MPQNEQTKTPLEMFGRVSDEEWRRLNIEDPDPSDYLPGLTDPELEKCAVGLGGTDALAEGFRIYELFKSICPLRPSSRVLDFGCGWGRVIRFFLKDVEPQNLIGIDAHKGRLRAAKESNRWCRFERCETFPPSGLEESFDLIYAYSVFSHLSEKAHLAWLGEFTRLLKPDGTLILTTFQRGVLANPGLNPARTERFAPLDQALAAYDRGEFCYRPQPGQEHFGDAFIPERYTRERWPFTVRDYFGVMDFGQDIIVCSR